jgi:hypothetical protein
MTTFGDLYGFDLNHFTVGSFPAREKEQNLMLRQTGRN